MRCTVCGVLSYAPRNAQRATCPECGIPIAGGEAEIGPTEGTNWRLDQLLRMTRDLLDTDVALLTEIRDGRETVQGADGQWPGVQSFQDGWLALEHTFCQRMLDGRIGNYVRDATTDTRVNDLDMARNLGVRAWLGVPIRLSDMRLYVLCCLASESRPNLGEREVRLLTGLAESVRAELQASCSEE